MSMNIFFSTARDNAESLNKESPCASLKARREHRALPGPTGTHGDPRGPTGTHGDPRGPTGTHGDSDWKDEPAACGRCFWRRSMFTAAQTPQHPHRCPWAPMEWRMPVGRSHLEWGLRLSFL
ncbi:unnamed protein product [Lota lota]